MNPAAVAKPSAETPAPAPQAAEPVVPAAAPSTPDEKEFEGPSQDNALPGVFLNNRREPVVEAPKDAAPAAPPTDPSASGVVGGPGAASTPAPPAPAPKSKLKIGDLEFDDEQHAAHNFKTLRGMYRTTNDKYREALEQNKALQAQLLARATAPVPTPGASGDAPAGQPAQPAASAGGSQAAIDWQVFTILKDKHGLDVAQQWYDSEIQARTEAIAEQRVAAAVAELKKEFQPALEMVRSDRQRTAVSQIVSTMRTYRNPDGSEAYPELRDENAAELLEVRKMWNALDLPREALFTAKGLHTAIAVYRDAKARQARLGVGPKPPAVAAPAPAAPASPVASGDASRPSAHPLSPSSAEDIGERITRAPLNFDEELGFTVRRPSANR